MGTDAEQAMGQMDAVGPAAAEPLAASDSIFSGHEFANQSSLYRCISNLVS